MNEAEALLELRLAIRARFQREQLSLTDVFDLMFNIVKSMQVKATQAPRKSSVAHITSITALVESGAPWDEILEKS